MSTTAVDSRSPKHPAILCESCMGDGIEEGCEWPGESCYTCNGRGLVGCDCEECEPEIIEDHK